MAHTFPSPSTSQNWHNPSSQQQQHAEMASRRTRRRSVTPTGSALGSISGLGETPSGVRGSIPHMYSTSYGSPLAQLPDRNLIRGGGDIKKAAAEIFSTIIQDDGEAKNRRQNRPRRSARNASQEQGAAASGAAPKAVNERGRTRVSVTDETAENVVSPKPARSRKQTVERSQATTQQATEMSAEDVNSQESTQQAPESTQQTSNNSRSPAASKTTSSRRPRKQVAESSEHLEPVAATAQSSRTASKSSARPTATSAASAESESHPTMPQQGETRGTSVPIAKKTDAAKQDNVGPSGGAITEEQERLDDDGQQNDGDLMDYEEAQEKVAPTQAAASVFQKPNGTKLGDQFKNQPQRLTVLAGGSKYLRSDLLQKSSTLSQQARKRDRSPDSSDSDQIVAERRRFIQSQNRNRASPARSFNEERGIYATATQLPAPKTASIIPPSTIAASASGGAVISTARASYRPDTTVPNPLMSTTDISRFPPHVNEQYRKIVDDRAAELNYVELSSFAGQLRNRAAGGQARESSSDSSSLDSDGDGRGNKNLDRWPKSHSSSSSESASPPTSVASADDNKDKNTTTWSKTTQRQPTPKRGWFSWLPSWEGGIRTPIRHFARRASAYSSIPGRAMGQPGQYRLPRPRVPAGWRNSRLIKYLGLILASFLFFTVLHSARDLIGDISSGAGSAIGTDGSGWGWPGFGNGLWKPTLGGVLSDDQFADLKKQLDAKTSRTDETVKKLEKLLPGAIFARKDKAGNVIISPDFWDALKARFKHDGSILILDDKARLTDKHWKAIQERLGTDKTITAISEEWEDWKKRNEEHVNDHVKHPEKGHAGDAVISRSFVIDKIQTALAKNKKEIAKEMDTLRKELHGVIRGIQSEMGRGTTAGHPAAGLSRDEATSLIKKIVSQQITERQLQLASKSGKTSTLDAQLQMHQPNQFAPGNGALVDITLTSPTWAAPKERMNTNRWAKKPRPLYSFQPIDALSPWGGEPGHCWCAAVRSRNGDHVPADLSVRLPGFIVPRHLALEHINPDLTVDADATPKNIEVWAVYDHPDRRSSVINTFLRKFPNQDRNLVRQGLLQIGSFEYKYKAEDDGVFIYSFPSEIHSMSGAATDQVLIRAVTNVGGVDHTCIYRLRLYGSPREGLERTNIRRFDDWERGVVE